jgi:hypothetical protein
VCVCACLCDCVCVFLSAWVLVFCWVIALSMSSLASRLNPLIVRQHAAVARNQRTEARRIGHCCNKESKIVLVWPGAPGGLAWCTNFYDPYRQSSSRSDHRSRRGFRRGSCCIFPPSLVLAVADASRIACCCALDLSFCTSACLQNSVVVGCVYADGWEGVIKELKALLKSCSFICHSLLILSLRSTPPLIHSP